MSLCCARTQQSIRCQTGYKDLSSSDICKLLHIKQKDDTDIDLDHHSDQMRWEFVI